MRGSMNENVSGDYLYHCKDSFHCFNCYNIRDCSYCTNIVLGANDCQDIDVWGDGLELCYEGCCVGENTRSAIANLFVSKGAENIYYSQFCSRQVRNLFGCIGLKHKENCIFNIQYSKAEYEELAAKIVQHMQGTKEWGEFFPVALSPFAYNESVAQEYFPLEKTECLQKGWRWTEKPAHQSLSKKVTVTNDSANNGNTQILVCPESGRQFKLQQTESVFYQKTKLPLPTFHPEVRHQKRFGLRNTRKLWERECSGCNCELQTSYSPDSQQAVLCEDCYQQAII